MAAHLLQREPELEQEQEQEPVRESSQEPPPARIAVIGAGWWSQGWHLPQLQRNPNSEVIAIMQRSERPQAAKFLGIALKSKTELRALYPGVPIFSSCEELLADRSVMERLDGVVICTAHHCHAEMGKLFLQAGKHVFMEKPMTVDVAEARELAEFVEQLRLRKSESAQASVAAKGRPLAFMVNNTANFRPKCFAARELVASGELGDIHHALVVMYSPLMFLFDDPDNESWTKPTGTMVQPDGSGNGFGWGQLSHVLAWVLHVGALDVEEVTAMTHRSHRSGADLMDAALIRCRGNISVSLSGGCGWPGNEHGEEATGKHFDIKLFGSKGVLLYGGDDKNPDSGRLELRRHDGSPSFTAEGFEFENTETEGNGPESLLEFIAACRGLSYTNGADHNIGLQAVRVLDALYRSAASGKSESTR